MKLKIGIKGKFEDIQGNPITNNILDLSAPVDLDTDYHIIHNETDVNLFFKEISPPSYFISSFISSIDPITGLSSNSDTQVTHNWKPIDGLYLTINEIYEYIISLVEIDFTTNEPPNPNTFDKYINNTNGFSSITNINMIANNVYEWQGPNKWINISPTPSDFTYISTLHYIPNDMIDNLNYPGYISFNSDNMKSKLSQQQLSDTINHYNSLGYQEQIDFLNGTLNSPFQPSIYHYNPIVCNYIPNDNRGATDCNYQNNNTWLHENNCYKVGLYGDVYPNDLMNNPNNPHLENFTKIVCNVTYNNNRNNKYSIIEGLQHQPPEDIDFMVGNFLKNFISQKLKYYREGNINEFNLINS